MRWLVNIINGINADLDRLKGLDEDFKLASNRSMSELQMVQKHITEHRKAAVKIPNAVYKIFYAFFSVYSISLNRKIHITKI